VEVQHKIVVIGAGVVGLSTAVVLSECSKLDNSTIQIIDKVLPPGNQASALSSGLVYYPALLSEKHGRSTIERFKQLSTNSEETGVVITPSVILRRTDEGGVITKPADFTAETLTKLQELDPSFRKATTEELKGAPNGMFGPQPVIAMPTYLQYLKNKLDSHKRVSFEQANISSLQEVFQKTNASVIINAAGIGAGTLTGESVTSLSSHMMLLKHTGKTLARDNYVSYYDETNPSGNTYYFPRQDGCILGGTDTTAIGNNVDDTVITNILARVDLMLPELSLKDAQIERTWVGSRPIRASGVRLEVEETNEGPVVHNYGHGLGITTSWTSAETAVELVIKRLNYFSSLEDSSLKRPFEGAGDGEDDQSPKKRRRIQSTDKNVEE